MPKTKKTNLSSKPKRKSARHKRTRVRPITVPSANALALAIRASTRVKERHTPIRHSFVGLPVSSDDLDRVPPLALMLRGSRGGAVRIRLYLALLWQAGGGDARHSVTWPARAWAELLDLRDPDRLGERRVRDAIRALQRQGLITTEQRPGQPSRLIVLREDGSALPYTHPGSDAQLAKEKGIFDESHLYVQLPPSFWTRGWGLVLHGPALAMLLVMLIVTQGGEKQGQWVSPSQARSRFGLSEDTWTRGIAELQRLGLLTVRKKPVSEDFGWRRVRNTYSLHRDRLEDHPQESLGPTGD